MAEDVSRLSLKVVSPPRPQRQGATRPRGVVLSEPMRRFRCNQKGCCCRGWSIPFQLEDFLKLHERLGEPEKSSLGHGLKLILEPPKDGKPIDSQDVVLHSLKLDGIGEDSRCRFLEEEGACRVHGKYGLDALPDLCVDFPAFPFRTADGSVELWWDPVCPEVLRQLDESDEPIRLHRQQEPFDDAGFNLRVEHAREPARPRLCEVTLDPADQAFVRDAVLDAFADDDRPPWLTLAAVLHGFRNLEPARVREFTAVPPEDPLPFLRFLRDCIATHGARLLATRLAAYRRFVYAVDIAPVLADGERLIEHLHAWEPAFETWLAPQEALLRPLTIRYLGHRFGVAFASDGEDLRAAADGVVLRYATALRMAAAMAAVLRRPVDRPLFQVALGAGESVHRSLRLPREALPCFASAGNR